MTSITKGKFREMMNRLHSSMGHHDSCGNCGAPIATWYGGRIHTECPDCNVPFQSAGDKK